MRSLTPCGRRSGRNRPGSLESVSLGSFVGSYLKDKEIRWDLWLPTFPQLIRISGDLLKHKPPKPWPRRVWLTNVFGKSPRKVCFLKVPDVILTPARFGNHLFWWILMSWVALRKKRQERPRRGIFLSPVQAPYLFLFVINYFGSITDVKG